MRTCMRNNF